MANDLANMADMATRSGRRDHGEGSIYQRASDWRWIATVEAGLLASGSRKRVIVTSKGCEGGCAARCSHRAIIKRKLRDKRAEFEAAGQRTARRTVTVAKWSTEWLAGVQASVRPTSFETDRAASRVIVAAIGSVKLTDLTPADVRAVAAQLRRDGRSSSTALRYHGTLIRMLKAAAVEGYSIAPNVLLAEPPKKAVHDRQAIPLEDTMKILQRAANMPDGSRWALALLQGLRQAEALGLTWEQVDLDAGKLTVSWQLKSLRYLDRGDPKAGFRVPDGFEARHLVGATHLVRPKSAAGWRVQPLVPWAVNALAEWREASPDVTGLVWPGRTVKGRTWPRNAAADRDRWSELQAAAGVAHPSGRPYVVHEARNTTATLLMELRVPESVRIAIMGHSDIATTHGYEHVDLAEAMKALTGVADRLGLS